VAVEALRRDGLPFVSVLADPTYGGVSASYAMEADIRIGIAEARIGFAGPAVGVDGRMPKKRVEEKTLRE